VQELGLANARDVVKMLRWNEKYGIKFMRLSSEMFPFASHQEYGYKLAPFASEVLGEAGKVVAELGHRVTTHPGQVSWNIKTMDHPSIMADWQFPLFSSLNLVRRVRRSLRRPSETCSITMRCYLS
jgi:UV DNA damage repair endonuclease